MAEWPRSINTGYFWRCWYNLYGWLDRFRWLCWLCGSNRLYRCWGCCGNIDGQPASKNTAATTNSIFSYDYLILSKEIDSDITHCFIGYISTDLSITIAQNHHIIYAGLPEKFPVLARYTNKNDNE